jgi:hypothetical protein
VSLVSLTITQDTSCTAVFGASVTADMRSQRLHTLLAVSLRQMVGIRYMSVSECYFVVHRRKNSRGYPDLDCKHQILVYMVL